MPVLCSKHVLSINNDYLHWFCCNRDFQALNNRLHSTMSLPTQLRLHFHNINSQFNMRVQLQCLNLCKINCNAVQTRRTWSYRLLTVLHILVFAYTSTSNTNVISKNTDRSCLKRCCSWVGVLSDLRIGHVAKQD